MRLAASLYVMHLGITYVIVGECIRHAGTANRSDYRFVLAHTERETDSKLSDPATAFRISMIYRVHDSRACIIDSHPYLYRRRRLRNDHRRENPEIFEGIRLFSSLDDTTRESWRQFIRIICFLDPVICHSSILYDIQFSNYEFVISIDEPSGITQRKKWILRLNLKTEIILQSIILLTCYG